MAMTLFPVEELNCEMFIVGARNLKREAVRGDAFGLQIEVDTNALIQRLEVAASLVERICRLRACALLDSQPS